MGIMFVYQTINVGPGWSFLPYLSISLSLNIFLTLMIVIRLIHHARNTRTALGITGIGGLCKAIITMFIESCALYTVSSLLFIGSLGARNHIWVVFAPILIEIQVRAFSQPKSSDSLADATAHWTGHRSTTYHPAGRQQERVDE